MNILYTLPDLHFGGTANLLLQNLQTLQKFHTVHVVYFAFNTTLSNSFKSKGIVPQRIPYNGIKDLVKTTGKIKKFILNNDIELIHCNLYLDKFLIGFTGIIHGLHIPKISHLHSAGKEREDIFKYRVLDKMENFLDRNCFDNIITVSQAAYNYAKNERQLPENKMCIIYNGIMGIDAKTEKVIHDPLLFGTVCRFHPIKGLPRLLDCLYHLKQSNLDFKCYFVGNGSEKPLLISKIADLGLEKEIIFTGFRSDAQALITEFDFYLNSSLSESFGISVVEALSCGVPVIASNVGGLKEVVNQNNGVLIDFSDAAKAALGIKNFIENSKLNYPEFSKNAIKSFESKFSSAIYVEKLNILYTKLLKKYNL